MAVFASALFLWFWPPAAALLAWTLERSAPAADAPLPALDALVVLGAKTYRPVLAESTKLEPGLGWYATLRCRRAAGFWASGFRGRIIVSGGVTPAGIQANLLAEELVKHGIPAEAILREEDSYDTRQNAVRTATLLAQHQLRLVGVISEATHLRRAVAAFRRVGVEAWPIASDCYSCTFRWTFDQLLPRFEAAEANRSSLHEWGGWLAYGLRGWI